MHSISRLFLTGLLVTGIAGACSRPTGDFGRARPSPFHDSFLPKVGSTLAGRRGEPVSDFNLTADESEMRARAWNFVRAPHAGDWWLDSLVEIERTRLLPAFGEGGPTTDILNSVPKFALPALAPAYDTTRYYKLLHGDDYRWPDARFRRTKADIEADTALIPAYCAVAARVRKTDAERLGALRSTDQVDEKFAFDTYGRVGENEAVNSWVWRALRYRLSSYRYAIDHLAIETPSDRLWETNQAYDLLAKSRCDGAPALRLITVGNSPLPSRLTAGPDPFDQPVLQK